MIIADLLPIGWHGVDWRVVDAVDGEVHGCDVRVRRAVIGRVGEAVGAIVVSYRRVGERAVGIERQ